MSDRNRPWSKLLSWLPALLILLIPTVLVGSALGSGKVLYGADMVDGSFHIRDLVGRSLAEGKLPVWDSHAMCGFPLLAALQAGILYPPTWASLLLTGGALWGFLVLLHLALSGLFAYAWLRQGLPVGRPAALCGALLFMLSGYFVLHVFAGHASQISAYPWLPAILWRTERFLAGPTLQRGALLSASMALLILTGFPHFVLVAGLLAGARILWAVLGERRAEPGRWKTALGAAIALAWALLLAAPQLLPAMELVPHSQRVSAGSSEFSTSYSFPPENLLLFLVPGFFGDGVKTDYWSRSMLWEACAFSGIAGLALAAVGLAGRHRSRWFWAGTGLAGLLVALGRHSVFFEILHAFMPAAGFFRVPGRYLSVFVLSLAPLAALGMERLLTEDSPRKTLRGMALGAGVLAAALLAFRIGLGVPEAGSEFWTSLVGRFNVGELSAREPLPIKGTALAAVRHGALAGLTWASIVSGVIAAAFGAAAWRKISPRAAGWSVAGMGLLELLVFARPYFKSQEAEALYWPATIIEFMRKDPARPFRISSDAKTHVRDVGRCQAAGLDHTGGYEALALARYAELMNALAGFEPGAVTVSAPAPGPHPVYDLLGARHWMLAEPGKARPTWKEVAKAGPSTIFESPEAMPRAFIVPRATIVKGNEDRVQRMLRGPFDPRREVLLERDPGPGATGSGGTVKVVSHAPGEYALDVEAPGGGFLVLTEAHYPGWRAETDGKETEIFRANHFVQAIRVAPGTHRVTFRYRSTYLGTGFLLFGVGVAVPGGWALWRMRRRRAA